MLIYKITNRANGKVYIGQTVRKNLLIRWREHVHNAKTGKRYINRAIHKHGMGMFLIEPVYLAHSRKELNAMETFFIILHQSHKPENGYNMTLGGETPTNYWLGKKRSLEDRQKMRLAKLGTKQNPQVAYLRTRVHVGNKYNSGRIQSDEERSMRKRVAAKPMLGKHHSKETISKLRQYTGEASSAFGKKWVHSADRQKMVDSHEIDRYIANGWELGVTDGAKQKNRLAHKGIVPSVETLRRRSRSLKGKKRSIETKKRMSEAAKNRGVPMSHIRLMVKARQEKASYA